MAKEKKSQGVMEELEGEVNEDLHPLLKKVEEHIKTIGLVVGLIILSAAAYSGYDYYQEKSFEQAKTKLGDILAEKQGPSKPRIPCSRASNWNWPSCACKKENTNRPVPTGKLWLPLDLKICIQLPF